MKLETVLGLLFAFTATISSAQETEIRVLGMYTNDASLSTAATQLQYLKDAYATSGNPGGVAITLANFGIPLPLSGGSISSDDAYTQFTEAQSLSRNLWATRNIYAADIVILFVNGLESPAHGAVCGATFQPYWIDYPFGGSFQPNSSGLDLRGSEDFYLGLVETTNPSCLSEIHVAAHEFGHMLGAGHETSADGESLTQYLFVDSHAHIRVRPERRGMAAWGEKSVLASGNPQECADLQIFCSVKKRFSDFIFGSTLSRNVNALLATAQSVAHYRTPPPQPCTLTRPYDVQGEMTGACTPTIETQHDVWWEDTCPSATDFYQVWYEQPATFGGGFDIDYEYGWNRFFRDTPVEVTGADSNIKIKACDNLGGVCTHLSNTYYRANVAGCEDQ